MTKDIERLVDLYKLLNSGNYVYDNTVSFIDFIRILRLVKFNSDFHKCFKKSHLELISFIGIIEFLHNVNVIKLNKKKRIKLQNDEIFELLYKPPSKSRMFLKTIRKIPYRHYLARKLASMSKTNLLELYEPKFRLNPRSFQIPCSLRSSLKRARVICDRAYFTSQKTLFIGDDDLISILCKFIIPELPITVIEIDGRITKLLKNIAIKHKFKEFNVYNLDFKEINELSEFLKNKFSIIHLDPPYDEKELLKFTANISLILDENIVQIFLNGLYDVNCVSVVSNFITKNKLIISDYYRSFSSYFFKSTDSKYLKYMKKQLKLETDLKFKEKDLKKIEFSSDLYVLEKSLTEKDINSYKLQDEI